ncbi:MAG: chorismate synthase [Actinomycetia bacterium]|nr:chorismate synthase [Actinomycetes bacterium]
MTELRVTTAGESHGPAEVCVVEGIPAGLAIRTADIDLDLSRRQRGYGRGARMSIESDRCRFIAGVRQGRTLGSPICLLVENLDHANWLDLMSPEPRQQPSDRAVSPISVPRPGHADLSGSAKYGHTDIRDVVERASARETVGRVAGGAVCRRFLAEVGVMVRARVVSIGAVAASTAADPADPCTIDWDAAEASAVGCDDQEASAAMCAAIDRARDLGESLGGVFEIWCWGLCPGLGGYARMEDRLDGRLLGAVGSIPAVKAVELGNGFANAAKVGSEVHDPLTVRREGRKRWIARDTNRAAGLEGGMTTGMPVVVRAGMKPIPTLTTPLRSVDISTLEEISAHVERSDITAVPAAGVVGEAMVAIVIAAAYLAKFGGDSMSQFLSAVRAYEAGLEERGLWRRS